MNPILPSARDKLLFTPGPLTTSLSVKQAMLHDAGSWHFEFHAIVKEIRLKLLAVAGVDAGEFDCVIMQGSGTFGVESVIGSTIPPNGKLLVLVNGAYGERILQMAQYLKIAHVAIRPGEDKTPTPEQVDAALAADPSITHVAMVHCETTTGIFNPPEEIGRVVSRRQRTLILDAMSSFGAVPVNCATANIDYLVSSANKCIEGVPGFAFVIARKSKLLACDGYARSLSLDLVAQAKYMEKTSQFRYTPPTHSILAFSQALKELELEGGIDARAARYQANHRTLLAGMRQLGFRSYLPPEVQSYIITSFYYPSDPKFTFM
ncbi:MAG TPA: 2-aminoethylphosphonate--pyruvate transaminase, partial [Verrucomicrobiae bacterium]|nr:2-aminoethylphosphonate--pyruvate transaminase [Verrucomicrobiae bacterium]